MKKILILSYLFIFYGAVYGQAVEVIPHPTQDAVDLRLNISPMVNSTGSPYTTFTAVGKYGCNATSDGSGLDILGTADEIQIVNTISYVVTFNLVLNSGWLPGELSFRTALGGTYRSNPIYYPNISEGANEHILTATGTTTAVLQFYHSSKLCDFEIRNLKIVPQ